MKCLRRWEAVAVWEGVHTMAAEGAGDDRHDGGVHLTEREIEVLRLILEGIPSKEAAAILCCSKRTVDFHLARVYEKLEVSNRVQAMRRVADMGLISLVSEQLGKG